MPVVVVARQALPLAALSLALAVTPATAQMASGARAGVSTERPRAAVFASRADTAADRRARAAFDRKAARVVVTALGGAAGIAAGAAIGWQLLDPSCGGCDDPGLNQATLGAWVAGGVGMAVFSALPHFAEHRRSCRRYADRLGRGYMGALSGSLVGVGAMMVAAMQGGGYLSYLAVPARQLVGTSIAMGGCDRPRR